MLNSIRVAPALAFAVLTTACGLDALTLVAEGSFTRTLAVTGPVDLTISTGSGSIDVRTGSTDQVHILGRIRAHGARWNGLSADEQVRRLEADPPIRQSGGAVRLGLIEDRLLGQGVSISYEVTVPPNTSVRTRSGSGRQRIGGVRNDVDASAGSGRIFIEHVAGPVRASAGSGAIELIDTEGGLDVSTGSGAIRADGVDGPIRARAGSGRVQVAIESAEGDVDISTGSGSIAVSGVRGGVRLRAGSGRIVVDGEPIRDWNVKASSGSVEMRLPPNAAFDLDASTGSGSINSAHPIQLQGTLSRRRVQGRVRGGGPRIDASTGSGSIRID
jgi:hypothetical protein